MDFANAKENLSRDFQNMLRNAKDLIEATSGEMDQKTRQARQKLEESLKSAQAAYEVIQEQVKEQAKCADKLVHEKPYHAMGVTFAVGLLMGWLVGRK